MRAVLRLSSRLSLCVGLASLALLLGARMATESFCKARPRPAATEAASAPYRPNTLRTLSLGNEAVLRAWLWTRLAADASYEQWFGPGPSWEATQLEALTKLDRNFAPAYRFGAAFLSTLRRDREGALALLQRGVRYFPFTWRSHYLLGYHLAFEMDRGAEAWPYLSRASTMEGAPLWLAALSARTLAQSTQPEQLLRMLLEMYPTIAGDQARVRLRERLRSARYLTEKARWTDALARFRTERHSDPRQTDDLRPFLPPIARDLASMALPSDAAEELLPVFREPFSFRYEPTARRIAAVGVADAEKLEQAGLQRAAAAEEKKP